MNSNLLEEGKNEPNFSYYQYSDNDQILNNRYIKIQDLNKGSYGNITLARDLKTTNLVAIKYYYAIKDDDSSREDDESIDNIYPPGDFDNCLYEYNILKTLHNNISATASKHNTGLVDSIINAVDQFDAYLVMDYCSHGDLYDAIRSDIIPRSSKMLFHLTNQLTNCLEFIHINGVFHRDIKPENILIYDVTSWQLKLTDFGLATIDQISNEKDIGSERYMAPELFLYDEDELCNLDTDNDEFFTSENNNATYDTDKVDIWALGITFLNIVFHKNPFEIAKPNMDKIFKYYCYNREAILDIFDIMTPKFYKLIASCLQLNPSDRNFETVKSLMRSCKEFTFDDYLYNSTEESLYKDVFVDGWDDDVVEDKTTQILPPTPPSVIDDISDEKEESLVPYNPIDINTKHYETASDVLSRQQMQTGTSWKAKNLHKFNRNVQHRHYNNNGESLQFIDHKFNDKNRRNNLYHQSNNSFAPKSANGTYTKQGNYYTRKPLGIPKPNKHILKYNENSPNLQYSSGNGVKNGSSQKPMSFKSSYNSHSTSFMNSYHPNHNFITKNGITNTHYNKNFNHYMKTQNNYIYSSDHSQEEDNKNASNEDDFDLDSDFKSESFENNTSNGKFQTAHEYMKVQQSLKNLSDSRKNTYKTKQANSSNIGSLSQNEDDDILFTLEEDQYGMDDSNGTIDSLAADNFANSFNKIDLNGKNSLKPNVMARGKNKFEEQEKQVNVDDIPELLKSPVSSFNEHSFMDTASLKKQKNVYISPANRRSSNTFGNNLGLLSTNNRRKSHSAGNTIEVPIGSKIGRNIQSSSDSSHFKKFHRPSFINSLTAKPSLSISNRHMDVFSDNEDAENEKDVSAIPFNQRNGRKSVNEEIVNMEDYKNNWLSLQLEGE
ncbi:hypothetical protein QEN19_001145 [Hanseniaspora menglaensis]